MTGTLHIPPSGYYRILKNNATVFDVSQYMVNLIRGLKNDFYTASEAELMLMQPEPILEALANRAYNAAYFQPDASDFQTIRTPQRLVRDERANCVDYTVFIGAIANMLGLPVVLRIVQLPGQSNFGHVYPIVDGVAIDVVPAQREDGKEYLYRLPGTKPVIGHEVEYTAKQDFFI